MDTRQAVKAAVKLFDRLDRSKGRGEQFDGFLELAYCAIAKRDPTASEERKEALEARYMAEVKRWPVQDVREVFPALCAQAAVWCGKMDFLGTLSGELELLRGEMGQFFTPWEVCRLMAGMSMGDAETFIKEKGYMTIQEPAVGAGAMVLAAAAHVRSLGHDPETTMFVNATDLSLRAFKMAYIQLSMACIPAMVHHGNSLSLEVFERAATPSFLPFYLKHGGPFKEAPPDLPVVRKRTRRHAP